MEKCPIYEKSKEIAKTYLHIESKLGKIALGNLGTPDLDMLDDYLAKGGNNLEYIEYLKGNRLDERR